METLANCVNISSINSALGVLFLVFMLLLLGWKAGTYGARVTELEQENKSLVNQIKRMQSPARSDDIV